MLTIHKLQLTFSYHTQTFVDAAFFPCVWAKRETRKKKKRILLLSMMRQFIDVLHGACRSQTCYDPGARNNRVRKGKREKERV